MFVPFVAAYYLSFLFRTINATIAGSLASEFALGAGDLGLLTSVYFLTFAAAQIPIGILLDRYGPRQVQSVVLVAAAAGAALFAASDNFLLLLAGRALIGLGVAAALTSGLKALVLWFPRDRVPLLNGLMIMLAALGAVTATSPAELLLVSIGWRGLFELLALASAGCAILIYFIVPDVASPAPVASGGAAVGLRTVYADSRFWRLAPLSASCIGTAWALQGLWAAPWFSDVEGLDRAALLQHLLVMAIALSLGALLLGVAADRLRRRGVTPQALLGLVAVVFIAAQLALILRLSLPSYIPWAVVAAVGQRGAECLPHRWRVCATICDRRGGAALDPSRGALSGNRVPGCICSQRRAPGRGLGLVRAPDAPAAETTALPWQVSGQSPTTPTVPHSLGTIFRWLTLQPVKQRLSSWENLRMTPSIYVELRTWHPEL